MCLPVSNINFLDNKVAAKSSKDYLVLKKGASLSIGSTPDELLDNNAKDFPTLPALYFKGTSPVTLYRQLIELTKITKVTAKDKTQWYQIPLAGLSEKMYGFIKVTDDNAEEADQLDLRKLGFMVIKEHDPNALGYAGDGFIDLEEQESIPQTKFFKDLFNQIDQSDEEGKKDGVLTAGELADAYKDSILGDQLRKLVGYHPSEWQGKSDAPKWKKLAETVLAGEENKALLKHEQERIDNLSFWDEIPELASSPIVYHFHPVEFIYYLATEIGPPWLIVAWEEHEKYKGIKETTEPLATAVREYLIQQTLKEVVLINLGVLRLLIGV